MDTTNTYRSKRAAYTTDAGPIDLDKLAEMLEYDIQAGGDRYATAKMYLDAAYRYGCNHGWYHAQDEELTRRQND